MPFPISGRTFSRMIRTSISIWTFLLNRVLSSVSISTCKATSFTLSVNGVFWVEWFPCTKPEVARAYAEAVKGLLSGQFRIVEFLQGGRPVKAILQRPTGEGWAVVARWSELHLPLPWGRTQRVLQNRTAVWGVP